MAAILVVEDNPQIREAIVSYLRLDGHEAIEAETLKAAHLALRKKAADLIILDVMLPDGDGFQFAKTLRASRPLPVIFLTAKADESDRITGFELGADDYVVKPFSPKELVLRVRAVLKRTGAGKTGEAPAAGRWKMGENTLSVDREAHRVYADGREIKLTAAEWKILLHLADHAGIVVARDALLERCLDYNIAVSERTIDTHIKNLRAKLGNPAWIETLRAFGYRFAGARS